MTNPDDIAWMNARLCSMPWHTHDQSLKIQNIQAKKLARSYVCCTDFKNFHFMAQRAKSEETWDYYDLKTGHDVMIIVPNDLVRLLLQILFK